MFLNSFIPSFSLNNRIKWHYSLIFTTMHQLGVLNPSCLSVVAWKLIFIATVFQIRFWFFASFSVYVWPAFLSILLCIWLLKEILKNILKIIKILYGIILLTALIIIHRLSWIFFVHYFLLSHSLQFADSWQFSLVLYEILLSSSFYFTLEILFIIFLYSCLK